MFLLKYRIETKIHIGVRRLCMRLKSALITDKAAFTHVTAYAVGNAGDIVLSECVRRTFDNKLSVSAWKLISLKQKINVDLIKQINDTKAVIIGGGGLFLPDTNSNFVSGWQWAISKKSLSCIQVPIVLYSVGYNYFRGQNPSSLFIDNLNEIVEKSVFVGLRNHGSIRKVQSLIREDLKEKVIFQPCTTTVLRFLLPGLPEKVESKNIAFNFAFDRMKMRFGKNQEEIFNEIVKSIYAIHDKGYEIYIIAHCVQDLTAMNYLKENIGIHIINASWWGMERLAEFYNNMDVVIGMRGHAQMIPFGVNCQIITLGSHEKMKWFLEDINAMDWYIELTENIESLSQRIIDKFVEVHEKNGKETDMRLVKAQKEFWDITCSNADKIRQLLHLKEGGG